MNVSFRSRNWRARILSNLAHAPFTITVNGEEFECNSVEGFWQGLKCKGEMRKHVFLLSGLGAKRAGSGKKRSSFEIAGQVFRVGGDDHAELIKEAIRQKTLQNPKAMEALRASGGRLTHRVPRRREPIFKMERFLRQLYNELCSE